MWELQEAMSQDQRLHYLMELFQLMIMTIIKH